MTYSYDRRATYLYEEPGKVNFLKAYYPWVATNQTRGIDAKIAEAHGAHKVERTFDWGSARPVMGGWEIPWTAFGTFRGKGGNTPKELSKGLDTVTLEAEGGDALRLHLDSKCPEVAVSFPYRDPDYVGVIAHAVNDLLRMHNIRKDRPWMNERAELPQEFADNWPISVLGGRKQETGWQIPFEAPSKGISGTLIVTSRPQAAKTGRHSVFLSVAAEAVF